MAGLLKKFFYYLFKVPRPAEKLPKHYVKAYYATRDLIDALAASAKTPKQNRIVSSLDNLVSALGNNNVSDIENYIKNDTLCIGGKEYKIYENGKFNKKVIDYLSNILVLCYGAKELKDKIDNIKNTLGELYKQEYENKKLRFWLGAIVGYHALGITASILGAMLLGTAIPLFAYLGTFVACWLPYLLSFYDLGKQYRTAEAILNVKNWLTSTSNNTIKSLIANLKEAYDKASNNNNDFVKSFVEEVVKKFSEKTGVIKRDVNGNLDVKGILDDIKNI